MDLYYTDPAQHRTTAGEEPNDLDNDLSDLSDVFGVWKYHMQLAKISGKKKERKKSTAQLRCPFLKK